MANVLYYLAVAALLVTIGGIGWAIWINFAQGSLAIVLGWISALLLLALGTTIEEYHK
nr:MAG TPA: hypothetical protein [Caudoviricetes sp.]